MKMAGFSVERMSSYETGDKSLYQLKKLQDKWQNQCGVPLGHTRKRVQSPLVVLGLKVRKGGDFFYGKSSNENHIEGL